MSSLALLFVVAVLVMCGLSHRVQYYVKFFVYLSLTFVYSIIFIPIMIIRGKRSSNGLMPAFAVRHTMRLLLGLTFDIRGLENIVPEGQGCVVLLNHQSSIDVIVMTHIWRYIPIGSTIAKRELFWVYPFPWLWNTVFINRLNPNQAKNEINQVGQLINTKHMRICMFPEGTRNSEDQLLTFKKGAFHIAVSAQCPIQPVVVSKYTFVDHKKKIFEPGHSIVEFLPAIPTTGVTKEQIPELMDKTRSVMQQAFDRLSLENAKNK